MRRHPRLAEEYPCADKRNSCVLPSERTVGVEDLDRLARRASKGHRERPVNHQLRTTVEAPWHAGPVRFRRHPLDDAPLTNRCPVMKGQRDRDVDRFGLRVGIKAVRDRFSQPLHERRRGAASPSSGTSIGSTTASSAASATETRSTHRSSPTGVTTSSTSERRAPCGSPRRSCR
jgi:hypothetical protein